MLYPILKIIFRIALKVFFTKIKIKGKSHIPPVGTPLLVVSNHPNTFMDPILIAHFLKQEVFFLANSSVFNTPFNRWFLKKLNMIPIQRREDTNQKKYDNAQIFQKCFEHLKNAGCILIFPEGTSIQGRRLQKIKTGAARIALGAENAYQNSLGVKILPVGLNYSKPESFRSEVFIQVGEPIEVNPFAQDFQEDSEKAVDALTELIRERIARLTIITDDHEEDELTKNIETVYKNQLSEDLKLAESTKEQDFLITRGIVDAIHYFEENDFQRIESFKPKIKRYLNNLQRLRLNDSLFDKSSQDKNIFWDSLRDILFLLIGFPFYVYGVLNNYIPYIIPSKVALRMTRYVEYIAPIMMVTGIFTFGVCYPLQIWLIQSLSQRISLTLFYVLSLPLSGFFALYYAHYLFSTQDKWRLFALFYKRSHLVAQLIQERQEIIQVLEKAKNDYLAAFSEGT